MRYTFARAFGMAAGLVMGAAFGAAVVWSVSAAADVVVARFPDPLYRPGGFRRDVVRAAVGADVDGEG